MNEKNKKNTRKNHIFDGAAILFIVIHIVLLFSNWHNYPTELDTPYHLLMGKMFTDNARVELWDSYELAPLGRPHLYPPMQHIFIWFLRSATKVSYMNIGRMIALGQIILGLFFVWFITRKFFNPPAALFSLIFFASHTESWWWQSSVAPIAIITVLFLPFIFLFYRKKVILPTALLTFCLYLHYGLSFALITSISLATLFAPKYRKEYSHNLIKIIGLSILLFIPWVLHVLKFRHYIFSAPKNLGNLPLFSFKILLPEILLNLNILVWIFLIAGLFYCYKKRKEDFKYPLLCMSFLSHLIFIFLFLGVRFNAHTSLIASVLAGVGAMALNSKHIKNKTILISSKIVLGALIVFSVFFEFHYLTPQLIEKNRNHIGLMRLRKEEVFFRKTPLFNELGAAALGTRLGGKHLIRVQDFFQEKDAALLVRFIKEQVKEDEIIHIENGALADYITLLTGRKTDSGMYWEVITPEMMVEIKKRRESGIFISRDSLFRRLLSKENIEKQNYPEIVAQLGKYYVGVLPGNN